MQTGARERTVRANGLDHHVIEWGPEDAADVVLCCHGFLDLGFGFAPLAQRLAVTGKRVIAFDFRGHGQTDWVGAGGYYHFPDYVLDLHELVPQLVNGPFHLLGHSMGGTVSCLFAATHPSLVRTLSLLEGLGPPAEDLSLAPARMQSWLSGVDDVRKEGKRHTLRDLGHAVSRLKARNPSLDDAFLRFLAEKATRPVGEALAWRFDPLHRTRSPAGFDSARFGQFLALIAKPTLVVLGSLGMRSGEDDARLARLSNGRVKTIEGAGHMMHWTHPDETATLLLEHLSA